MRPISTEQEALLVNPSGRTYALRVQVMDDGDVWRDLRTYVNGVDMVVAAKWSEDVDSSGWVADITIRRNNEDFSANPLMTRSALNRTFNPLNDYAPLLDLGREISIEFQVLPVDGEIDSGAWEVGFSGRIDTLDLANDPIQIACRGLQGRVVDRFIEVERVYNYAQAPPFGAAPTRGCRIFERDAHYLLDELVIPSQTKLNDRVFKTTGTTGPGLAAGEPDIWPTTLTDTIVVGDLTFTCEFEASTTDAVPLEKTLEHLLLDNMGSDAPALNVPDSPLWQIRWYVQNRQPLWSAMRALVDQIGWDLRFKWDTGDEVFKLTLWTPDRSKTTPDRSFGEFDGPDINGIRALRLDLSDIRNVIRVVVSDSADIAPDGQPRRKVVEVSDADSIAAYGRRFCEIAESSTANLDSISEATDLADRILSDLSTPLASHDVELAFFPWAEVGDLFEFPANSVHYSTAQKLAVVAVEHSIETSGKASTTLRCRGKVCGGYGKWLVKDVRAQGKIDIHAFNLVTSPQVNPEAIPIVGGTRIKTDVAPLPAGPNIYFEHYFSPNPAFLPDSSSLAVVTADRDIIVPDQVPGATLYHRTIPVWFNASRKVRGEPSAALEVIAGRASAGHIQGGIALGSFPLNGGFETRFDPTGMPDHWSILRGVYGTDVIVVEDTDGISGGRYLQLVQDGASDVGIASTEFPLVNEAAAGEARKGGLWRMTVWRRLYGGNDVDSGVSIKLQLLDYAGALISGSAAVISAIGTDRAGHWVKEQLFFSPGAYDTGVRSARLEVYLASEVGTIDIDEVRVEYIGSNWHDVGDTPNHTDGFEALPGFENTWSNVGGGEQLSFRVTATGEVQLKGTAKSTNDLTNDGDETNDSNTVFSLPTSLAPSHTRYFIVSSSGLPGHVAVLSTGEVRVLSGQKEGVSFDQVRFVPSGSAAVPTTLTTGLIGYWKLDSDSTDSLGTSNGTDSGVSYGSGHVGSGALTGGASAKVLLSNAALQPAGAVTAAAWVKTSTGGQKYIVCSDKVDYPYNYGGFSLLMEPTHNKAEFGIGKGLNSGFSVGTDLQQVISTTALNDGVWHHVAGTYDGATIKIYVDGVLEASQAWVNGLAYTGPGSVRTRIACESVTIFGVSTDPYGPWPGQLDEVGIWSRALTAGEIATLYNAGAGTSYPF